MVLHDKAPWTAANLLSPHKIRRGSKWISMHFWYRYVVDFSEVLFHDSTFMIWALVTFRVQS